MTFEKEFNACKEKEDTLDKTNCIYGVLHRLTRLQDDIQLSVPAINESVAISNAATDKANAIMLELSKWRGDLEPIIKYGYFLEKVRSLNDDYNALAHDYGIIFGVTVPMIEHKLREKDFSDISERRKKDNEETIFRNIRYNSSKNKLEKVV